MAAAQTLIGGDRAERKSNRGSGGKCQVSAHILQREMMHEAEVGRGDRFGENVKTNIRSTSKTATGSIRADAGENWSSGVTGCILGCRGIIRVRRWSEVKPSGEVLTQHA